MKTTKDDFFIAAIAASLEKRTEAGREWVLVPRELTMEMRSAMQHAFLFGPDQLGRMWADALAAAPAVSAEPVATITIEDTKYGKGTSYSKSYWELPCGEYLVYPTHPASEPAVPAEVGEDELSKLAAEACHEFRIATEGDEYSVNDAYEAGFRDGYRDALARRAQGGSK
jgi:hypothetical protein